MSKPLSISYLASAVIAAAALASCDRGDDVNRPKVTPGTTLPKAPAGSASADRSSAAREAAIAAALPAVDRTFVEKAASSGMAELAITEHVIDKAASPEVKKIAEHLHKDHTEANLELAKIATSKGLTLPATPDGEKKAEIEKISALAGAELDRTVLERLEQSHRDSISLFEREVADGSDPELKAFASKTLPTLREHLKMVEAGRGGDGVASAASK